MDRRAFLKKSSLVFSSAAVAGAAGLFPRNTWALGGSSRAFSIDVVTDRPDRAIRRVEQVLQGTPLGRQTVQFAEHPLQGRHVGDIAYVQSQRLIDYRRATDEVSRQLRQVAAALSLPRQYDNPVLLRFYAQNRGIRPTEAHVFSGDILVKQLPLNRPTDALRIEGPRGHVDVVVENHSVAIVSASCKHKTCVNMGAINQAGQHLVCIPNQMTVAIAGTNRLGVDGVTF